MAHAQNHRRGLVLAKLGLYLRDALLYQVSAVAGSRFNRA